MIRNILTIAGLAVAMATANAGTAASAVMTVHPGGLDSRGCHGGSRPYHCHRSQSQVVRTADGRNRLRCDLGSRSQECTGAGATMGLGSSLVTASDPAQVVEIQLQLIRHCSGLETEFADGVAGEQTRLALVRFQKAYGLTVDGLYGPETEAAFAQEPNGLC